MIQNVWLGLEHDLQAFINPLKIGNQYLNFALGRYLADLPDGLGKNPGAAEIVVVAIHAGHHRVLQAQSGYGFGHPARLVPINGLRPAFGHGAKSATPRAQVAQQHEGGGAMVPAFPDVGTLRRFANRMQMELPRQFFQLMIVLAHRRLGAQPSRFRLGTRWRERDLDEFRRGGHAPSFYLKSVS